MLRAYKNFEFEAPHQHAIYYASYLIQDAMWLNEEKLDQLQSRWMVVWEGCIVRLTCTTLC
jgi:hypothetical protein